MGKIKKNTWSHVNGKGSHPKYATRSNLKASKGGGTRAWRSDRPKTTRTFRTINSQIAPDTNKIIAMVCVCVCGLELLTLTGVPYIGQTPKPIGVAVVAPKHALTTRHHLTLRDQPDADRTPSVTVLWIGASLPKTRRRPHYRRATPFYLHGCPPSASPLAVASPPPNLIRRYQIDACGPISDLNHAET